MSQVPRVTQKKQVYIKTPLQFFLDLPGFWDDSLGRDQRFASFSLHVLHSLRSPQQVLTAQQAIPIGIDLQATTDHVF